MYFISNAGEEGSLFLEIPFGMIITNVSTMIVEYFNFETPVFTTHVFNKEKKIRELTSYSKEADFILNNGKLSLFHRTFLDSNTKKYNDSFFPFAVVSKLFFEKITDFKKISFGSYSIWVDSKCNSGHVLGIPVFKMGDTGICKTSTPSITAFRDFKSTLPLVICNNGNAYAVTKTMEISQNDVFKGEILDCFDSKTEFDITFEYDLVPNTCK